MITTSNTPTHSCTLRARSTPDLSQSTVTPSQGFTRLRSVFSLTLIFWLSLATASHASPSSPPSLTSVACPPGDSLVRSAGTPPNQILSNAEEAYISTRESTVLPKAWFTYLRNVFIPSFVRQPNSSVTFSSDSLIPRVGIALSGGSYRAALFGAGVLSSLDGRNKTAVKTTRTGGLLQASTYITGLSGGAWLVTSLAQANFPTIPDLIIPPTSQANSALGSGDFGGWLTQFDLTNPGPGFNGSLAYLEGIVTELIPKFRAGFPTTITDMWSRAISRHFVNGTTAQNILTPGVHGAGVLFSDIANVPTFVSHEQPFPIVLSNSIPPQSDPAETLPGWTVPLTSEIWEFNVFETGSFDPSLSSFIPTSLLGSFNSSLCFAGFDQAGFVAGVSSSIFSSFNTSEGSLQASPIEPVLQIVENAFGPQNVRLDAAAVPNPFKGVNPQNFSDSNQDFVTMVDGGLNGVEIPIHPLLVRARDVDVIIAIDGSGNTIDNFANGTALINSAKRAALFGSVYPFPTVPSTPDIFVSQNLTRHPTFFGCNEVDKPLIIYIANGGPPADGALPVTNSSTFRTSFSPEEVQAILYQSFDIGTQSVHDQDWGTCLLCAVLDRELVRLGLNREGVCQSCFDSFCWPAIAGEGSE